ncbi:MAG: SulP family inorganic anion transporter [Nocardioides sp.]|nr:SulP family inorganic anion transporter [Nocardioides sp.]
MGGRTGAGVAELLPQAADWRPFRPGADLTAGLMVGLVALPLALGFGASSGLGAGAGLVTAIVAGAVAAVFGGSRVQVSGPTGAMTVVLVPIVATHGADGVLVVGLLAGAILLGLAYVGAGRFIRYVPVPVVEGFTLGIAAIIALQQLPAALGVRPEGEEVLAQAVNAITAWLDHPAWAPLCLAGGVTAAILLMTRLMSRVRPGLPWSLIAVVAATVVTAVAGLDVAPIGDIPAGLPLPALPTVPLGDLGGLVLPAVAVAALAALESLLSATVADAMSVGRRHHPDRELVGQGLANLAAPLFGGIPATAAIARTAVNVRSGATTRLASLSHSVVLLAVVLVAARWVGEIPLAALAGVLVATAFQMVRLSSVAALLRATRGDAAVLVVTAVATVAVDLVTAVIVGLVVAGFFALRQTALAARLDEVPLEEGIDDPDDTTHADEERRLLDQHIVAYRMEGPLFFAAAHDFLLELSEVSDVRVVVLRMSRLSTIDATGASVLADTIARLEGRGITVLLSGLQPRHDKVLRELGVHGRLGHDRHLFATTPEAIAHARRHVAREQHTHDTSEPHHA